MLSHRDSPNRTRVPSVGPRDRSASLPLMPVHILDAMAREGFEELHALNDRRSGLRGFLGVHDTTQGPAFGGVRRFSYRDEREALLDCLRLSRAMTHKCALMELPAGGAKFVLLDRPDIDFEGGYEYLGEVVERLAGRVYTGPDVGTGPEELAAMASRTGFVTDPGPDGPGELAESTAEGVFQGMASALRQLDGDENWPARRVVIQGLGAIGERLARRLVELGATVIASDVDEERAARLSRELDFEEAEPFGELSIPCDVFAPCAMGGILHDLSIQRLACRVVAGGANNVLAKKLHGDVLHERGILFAPDFLINSGALIRGVLFHLEGRREPVSDIGARIGRVAEGVFARAAEEDAPPARIAVREAEERIERWRDPC